MRGTWQTDNHGSVRGGLVLAVIGAALLLGSSGAAAAIASAIVAALIAAVVVVVLAVAGLGALVVYRVRHPGLVSAPRVLPPLVMHQPAVQQLPTPERAALEPPAPREVHQHVHNDVHLYVGPGADPRAVAEIIRRSQRPE